MSHKEVVFLLPGFLGFERFEDFYYFDPRVSAVLRAFLDENRGYPVPVIPLDTLPSSSLGDRQKNLLKTIASYIAIHGRPEKIHLIGHSTGGTDAALLMADQPLMDVHDHHHSEVQTNPSQWSTIDPTDIRSLLRNVVAISAPQWGTCITESKFVRVYRDPVEAWQSIPEMTNVLAKLGRAFVKDSLARHAGLGAITDIPSALRWLMGSLDNRVLVDCLLPDEMTKVMRDFKQDQNLPDAKIHSVVTAAADHAEPEQEPTDVPGGDRYPDELFSYLYKQTAGEDQGCGAEKPDFVNVTALLNQVMNAADKRLIKSPGAKLYPASLQLNDGVVNTARQWVDIENPEDELLAFVIADHLDVLGYYEQRTRRYSAKGSSPIEVIRSGIFHSGSAFSDTEFVALYRRISEIL